jgi:hypothetical protein
MKPAFRRPPVMRYGSQPVGRRVGGGRFVSDEGDLGQQSPFDPVPAQVPHGQNVMDEGDYPYGAGFDGPERYFPEMAPSLPHPMMPYSEPHGPTPGRPPIGDAGFSQHVPRQLLEHLMGQMRQGPPIRDQGFAQSPRNSEILQQLMQHLPQQTRSNQTSNLDRLREKFMRSLMGR